MRKSIQKIAQALCTGSNKNFMLRAFGRALSCDKSIPKQQIAKECSRSRSWIYRVVKLYNEKGIKGLIEGKRSGRLPKVSDEQFA